MLLAAQMFLLLEAVALTGSVATASESGWCVFAFFTWDLITI